MHETYSRSKRGGCSVDDLAWLDRETELAPFPLPLPRPTAVEGGGASLGAVWSFLTEANIDPKSDEFLFV